MTLKYYSVKVEDHEIPNEICLAIKIVNCPNNCEKCQAPWINENIGEPLTLSVLLNLVKQYPDVTCVLFYGGDASPNYISYLVEILRLNAPHLRIAIYSGEKQVNRELLKILDYYKIGVCYADSKLPISDNIEQHLYSINRETETVRDITDETWDGVEED